MMLFIGKLVIALAGFFALIGWSIVVSTDEYRSKRTEQAILGVIWVLFIAASWALFQGAFGV